MKVALKEIKLGVGLGVLKFGMTRTEVKLILGEPSFIDKYSHSESDNDLTESWEYDDLKLSLSFDEEESWKVTMMSVNSNFYEFEGKSLIGKSEKDILTSLNINDSYLEDVSERDGENHKVIEIDKKSINFWFIDSVLDEIQWSPLFIDDDTINWPE